MALINADGMSHLALGDIIRERGSHRYSLPNASRQVPIAALRVLPILILKGIESTFAWCFDR